MTLDEGQGYVAVTALPLTDFVYIASHLIRYAV
jgi:hypothetical protein